MGGRRSAERLKSVFLPLVVNKWKNQVPEKSFRRYISLYFSFSPSSTETWAHVHKDTPT